MADQYGNPNTYDEYAEAVRKSGLTYEHTRIQGTMYRAQAKDAAGAILCSCYVYAPVPMSLVYSVIREGLAEQARRNIKVA